MQESGQINVNDRVLLHLSKLATDVRPDEFPSESTQAGIAFAVGISRTHVPRAVKGLVKDGLIEEFTSRVRGRERRMNVYSVTQKGLGKAEDFWAAAQDLVFTVMRDGGLTKMTGREMGALLGRGKTMAAISQMTDGIIVIDGRGKPRMRCLEDAPHLDAFYGREAELRAIDAFVESARRALVLLGNRGYGTTALARRFVETREDLDVLWVDLGRRTSTGELRSRIVGFGKRVSKDVETLADALGLETALYVFDGYFSVDEEIVELFSSLVDLADGAKLIVTARQEMPVYDRFYHKPQVDSGIVEELKIAGLDQESAKKLLGNDRIEQDALRRVLGMTRCQPMALKMLRDGDLEGLKRNTVLTAEEVRYLLFLREKTG